jgi:hypothetical protein
MRLGGIYALEGVMNTSEQYHRIHPPKTLDQARLRDGDLRLHFLARPCTA